MLKSFRNCLLKQNALVVYVSKLDTKTKRFVSKVKRQKTKIRR